MLVCGGGGGVCMCANQYLAMYPIKASNLQCSLFSHLSAEIKGTLHTHMNLPIPDHFARQTSRFCRYKLITVIVAEADYPHKSSLMKEGLFGSHWGRSRSYHAAGAWIRGRVRNSESSWTNSGQSRPCCFPDPLPEHTCMVWGRRNFHSLLQAWFYENGNSRSSLLRKQERVAPWRQAQTIQRTLLGRLPACLSQVDKISKNWPLGDSNVSRLHQNFCFLFKIFIMF